MVGGTPSVVGIVPVIWLLSTYLSNNNKEKKDRERKRETNKNSKSDICPISEGISPVKLLNWKELRETRD